MKNLIRKLTRLRRESSLRALLHRHPSPTQDQRSRLTDQLQIPVEWIHEAKAAQLASDDDAFGEYFELAKAGLYDRAHRILVDKLLPEAILRDDLELIKRLCETIGGKVQGWEYGGQVSHDMKTDELNFGD